MANSHHNLSYSNFKIELRNPSPLIALLLCSPVFNSQVSQTPSVQWLRYYNILLDHVFYCLVPLNSRMREEGRGRHHSLKFSSPPALSRSPSHPNFLLI